MLVETTGELLLENQKGPDAVNKCSGSLVGDIGPNGADDITEVLNAKKETTTIALGAISVACTGETSCENAAAAWAVGLPWLSLLELWEEPTSTGFVILLTSPTSAKKELGWYIECTVLGVKATEECTTPEAVAEAVTINPGVEGIFSRAFTEKMGLKLALCPGGAETGVVQGTGTTVTSLAGPLTVSE